MHVVLTASLPKFYLQTQPFASNFVRQRPYSNTISLDEGMTWNPGLILTEWVPS